ncbi:MAG: GHKL domain-containing protein [Candidatus Aminicenantes bacterium]|nr:MAG: GHKL domain-containing protein [Candidatus Aminicenantes bacterium]
MNMKKVLIFCAVLALFFPGQMLLGQSLPFKHYTKTDGLAASFVTCILQDSSDFLWFGTEHGLSRFNGREFKNVLAEEQGLEPDCITDLFEDQKGNLWIGTTKGVLIRMKTGQTKTYTKKQGLPDNLIHSIVEDQEGNLWLGTALGLSMFDGKNFTNYSKKNSLLGERIRDIIVDEKGNLWFGTEKRGVIYHSKRNGNPRFINYTKDNGLISNEIKTLTADHKGNIWIGTNKGLSCFQKEKAAFISYSSKDGLANNFVNCILENRDNNIWIGTTSGVSLLCPSSKKFTNYYSKNGLLHDDIYSIFEDKEGNTWFGTRKGVSRLHSFRITNFSDKDGLPDNYIWAIIEEREGKYWMGTDKGLSCYSDGTFKTYTTRDGLVNDSILNLLKDRAGNIWIATNGGLSVYSPQSKIFTNYSMNDGLPYETVLSLEEDMKGTIWIGTGRGLCRFINGRIVPPGFNFDLEPASIHAILQDKRGNLWISSRGLWRISGNKSTHYPSWKGLTPDIYILFEDSRGKIWIGTNRGLSCFSQGEFTNYSTADGLSDNDCKFVLEDDNYNLWIGTKNGLNRYDGKSFKTYTTRDGLLSNEMSHSTCLKDSQGNLWFGTVNGISRFNPRFDRINTVPPPVLITHLTVMGKDHPPVNDFSLKHDQNYIKFDFVGLSYTSPEDVVYKYRLQGTDSEWFETKDRYISYPSLTQGKYTFKVKAINNDGIESVNPAEIRFRILPPFWQTLWFRLVSILFLLSLAVLIVLLQFKRIKEKMAHEAKNKQLVMAQRMKLMGVLAGGAVHDLKNLLSIIIGYSTIVDEYSEEEDDQEKNEAVEIIKSTAGTAFQVVKQILAFTRQTYDETQASNLSELLEEILAILKITIPSTLKILWDPPKEEILLYINPVKFKQVVMNLCLNAIQAMGEQGELKISLAKDSINANQIVIEVSDTGPGIKEEHLDKIFDPLFTTKDEEKGAGLGLFVVKQIVDEYNGNIHVQSKPGQGTTFKIRFPIRELPLSTN